MATKTAMQILVRNCNLLRCTAFRCMQDEVNVIQGALDMATKTAEAAMTPLDKVGGW